MSVFEKTVLPNGLRVLTAPMPIPERWRARLDAYEERSPLVT